MKKPLKILSSIVFSLSLVLAIGLGVIAGNAISGKFFNFNPYASINIEDLKDDVSAIKYENKTPNQLSTTEAYLVAIEKLKTTPTYQKNLFGDIQTNIGINQTAHSRNTKNGNTYTQEFCTVSSMMKNAGKTTYTEGSEIVLQYGTPNGSTLDEVSWDGKTENYSYQEYSDLLGQNPIIESAYIVSSKTVTSTTEFLVEDGTYSFTLTLDPALSTLAYTSKIAFLSGVDKNTVKFSSVQLFVCMDKNFKILSETYTEVYSLKYSGIPVTLTATHQITITY